MAHSMIDPENVIKHSLENIERLHEEFNVISAEYNTKFKLTYEQTYALHRLAMDLIIYTQFIRDATAELNVPKKSLIKRLLRK